jgi:hypothetical protein
MASQIIGLAVMLLMLAWPQLFAGYSQRRHAKRLQELSAGGDEDYFEERRSLDTYPPLSKPSLWRFIGGLGSLALFGSIILRN